MLITTGRNQEDIGSLVSHRTVEKLNLKTFISSCDCCEANHALSQRKKIVAKANQRQKDGQGIQEPAIFLNAVEEFSQ